MRLSIALLSALLWFSFLTEITASAAKTEALPLGFSAAELPQQEEPESPQFLLLQPDFIADVQEATRLLYNQEFDASAELLASWFAQERARPVAALWDALPLWWLILSDLEAEAHDAAFIEKMELSIRSADLTLRRERQNLDALVVKTIAHGFLARLYANRGAWYRSLVHGRQAINLLNGVGQLQPDLPDLQFGEGLYSYFTAFFHEQYRLVRVISWMVPAGDMEEGLALLRNAAEESAFMVPEAVYFLAHIWLHYENDPETAEVYLNRLMAEYPQNLFFNRLMLRSYYQQSRFQEALQFSGQALERAVAQSDTAAKEEIYTLRGLIYYRMGQLGQAEQYLRKTLELAPALEKGEVRVQQLRARYQLGRLYERLGRTREAEEQFRFIVNLRTDSPVRQQARRHLR
ncbi:Tetratricopeptide repeat-containing protein [Cyclonatronum proteinivorum]|uniref:Tetratricopeptide repeat-containing protein n=1 Tax=Cyclonatronum proteinivorum TaxID=1457365 RepID=A0A345UFV1_9BACT|nr:tetratricopeptide repeat protein [Cyclonatronum proteinivorum]AXI99352.1 Tetratricopeptide repeat-containing protein [Cyclonatronum proteinivorum]